MDVSIEDYYLKEHIDLEPFSKNIPLFFHFIVLVLLFVFVFVFILFEDSVLIEIV